MRKEENITQLLLEISNGNRAVFDDLLPIVYDELKRLARCYLRRERRDHTLQPTALVNEACLKLIDQRAVAWQNREHFFGVAAHLMRRILLDYAKFHNAEKRGREFDKLPLDDHLDQAAELSREIIRLDEALRDLNKLDPGKARLVELRYFAGLTFDEAAAVLDLSTATVKRHWRVAKAFLYGHLHDE